MEIWVFVVVEMVAGDRWKGEKVKSPMVDQQKVDRDHPLFQLVTLDKFIHNFETTLSRAQESIILFLHYIR